MSGNSATPYKIATIVLVVLVVVISWWLWPPGSSHPLGSSPMAFYTGGPDEAAYHNEVWRLESTPSPNFGAHAWDPSMRFRFRHIDEGLELIVTGNNIQWPASVELEEHPDEDWDYFAQVVDIGGHSHNLATQRVTGPGGQTVVLLRLLDNQPNQSAGEREDEHGGSVHIGP